MKQPLTEVLYKRAVNFSKKKSRSYQDAEDLAQEAFAKCLERKDPTYKYVFTYVCDSAYTMMERANTVKRTVVPIEVEPLETLEEKLTAKERRSLVAQFLVDFMDYAPPAQQHVIASIALQWPSPQEYLVKTVGLSKPLASYHYKEAFKHLTGYLAQQGVI